MAKVYHPHYEQFWDRKTRTLFRPEKLGGGMVAAAEVEDPAPYLERGFLLWPEATGLEQPQGADKTLGGDAPPASPVSQPSEENSGAGEGNGTADGGSDDPEEDPDSGVPADSPFGHMTKAQIVEYAAAHGVHLDPRMTRAKMIEFAISVNVPVPVPGEQPRGD